MDEEKEGSGSQAGVCPVSRRWVHGARPDLAQKGTHIAIHIAIHHHQNVDQ
jgi:hypothetical protein